MIHTSIIHTTPLSLWYKIFAAHSFRFHKKIIYKNVIISWSHVFLSLNFAAMFLWRRNEVKEINYLFEECSVRSLHSTIMNWNYAMETVYMGFSFISTRNCRKQWSGKICLFFFFHSSSPKHQCNAQNIIAYKKINWKAPARCI